MVHSCLRELIDLFYEYEERIERMLEELETRIEQVREDREHGSRWLVREAMRILRDLAQERMPSEREQVQALQGVARMLAQARPAMAALSSAMSQIMATPGGPAAIASAASKLLEQYEQATGRIADFARPYLNGCIMTCSLSGTVLEVLLACQQTIEQVVVLEGRPRYEGRMLAQELGHQGMKVTLITDAQAAIFLPHCSAVVVGADSVLRTGDVLNKAGTALLAWAAHGYAIPFYVVCETLKISPRRWLEEPGHEPSNLALLEEKEAQEVLERPLPNVSVRNFYFDRTPSAVVTAWITEQGILSREAIAERAALVEADERQLMQGEL
jgi:ribose 1,5-bisphosphate isomerase